MANYMEQRGKWMKKGYEQGRADVLKNMDPSTSKLTATATLALVCKAEMEYAVGDQHMAFLLKLCVELLGHPETVEIVKQEADKARADAEKQIGIDL